MQKHKLFAGVFVSALQLLFLIPFVKSQDEEVLEVVTAEMFAILQAEIEILNSNMATLQDQLQGLTSSVQIVAADTTKVSNLEWEELVALIDVSNKEDEDISKLVYSNGLWQQNFRVINSTFERLRKVVVFPTPSLNNAPQTAAAVRRILPSVSKRNTTIVRTSSPPQKSLPVFKKVTLKKKN